MRFRVAVRIDVPRARAEQAFVDPDFYRALGEMPNIRAPEVLEVEPGDEVTRMRIRYVFDGHLPPAARRVLDPEKITWVDESTVHHGRHLTEFRMVPDHYANRMTCEGTYRFDELGPDSTEQVLEGDLIIHYPIVGRLVEKAILMGMRQHLQEEARLLEKLVAEA